MGGRSFLKDFGNSLTKIVERAFRIHLFYTLSSQQHGITTVADICTYLLGCLTGASVDNGNKVICDDDSVFARFQTLLSDDYFLDDVHSLVEG